MGLGILYLRSTFVEHKPSITGPFKRDLVMGTSAIVLRNLCRLKVLQQVDVDELPAVGCSLSAICRSNQV